MCYEHFTRLLNVMCHYVQGICNYSLKEKTTTKPSTSTQLGDHQECSLNTEASTYWAQQ